MSNKRKKLDPLQRRLNAIAAELGEIEGHLILDQSDVDLLRRAISLRDTLQQLYMLQVQQVRDILRTVATQYDIDSVEAAVVDLGQGNDLGLLIWPKTEKPPSDNNSQEEEVAA